MQVKERYLFAASVLVDGRTYVVDAGFGNLPLQGDREESALVAEFEQLIVEDARQPGLAAADLEEDEPCEKLTAPPAVRTIPQRGRAGSNVRVEASNVVRPEAGIWWRTLNNRIGRGEVRVDCTMTEIVSIANDARPGAYEIIVMDARGEQAQDTFDVIE